MTLTFVRRLGTTCDGPHLILILFSVVSVVPCMNPQTWRRIDVVQPTHERPHCLWRNERLFSPDVRLIIIASHVEQGCLLLVLVRNTNGRRNQTQRFCRVDSQRKNGRVRFLLSSHYRRQGLQKTTLTSVPCKR